MWFFCGRRRRRSEIRRVRQQIVRLGVVSHGLGADLGVYRFYGTEVVGRVFVKYVDLPFPRGSEYGATFWVKNSSINPAADRQTLDNFSVISIHYNKHFGIPRSNKKALV